MKSTLEKLEGLSRKLTVDVPAEKVTAAFDRAYKEIQKNATIKGFRKGKAPIATIRSLYSDQVRQDVLQDLISESYQGALEEHSLDPVGFPKVKFDHMHEDKDFNFTAEVEIRPEVQLKKFEGLKVQKEKLEIDEKQIEDVLKNIRESNAKTVALLEDRPALATDVAEIDFVGRINGELMENGSAENFPLELGSNRLIPGFESGVVGMNVGGSKTLNLNFPEDYHVPELAGKPVQFEVKLKSLKKKVVPELTDEMASQVGPFKTVQELKDAIRKDIENNETKRIQDDLRNRLLKALVQENPIQVPKSLMQQQKDVLIKDVQDRMQQQGMGNVDMEEYRKKWDADFEQTASFMVASTFLIDALADKMGVRPTDADVKSKISTYAKESGLEIGKIEEFYRDPDRRSRLMFQLTEEKVVDELLSKADLKEVAKAQIEDQKEA